MGDQRIWPGRRLFSATGAVRTAAHPLVAAAVLVLLTLATYAPALRADFGWDDDVYVTGNALLRGADGLRRIWVEPAGQPQYYPLTFTTFWIEYLLWGLQPLGYHLINLLLHMGNALLLWRLLRALHLPGAWLAAALFAVHPVQVESVAWITERKNVLSGAFALAAVLLYVRGMHADARASGARVWWRSSGRVGLLFVAALLSKTVVCTLPVVLALLAWWKRGTIDRRTVSIVAPLLVIGMALAAFTIHTERGLSAAESPEWMLSPIGHLLLAGRAWWFYIGKLIWPHPLALVYPRWSVDAQRWWQYLFPAAAGGLLLALYLARRSLGVGPVVAGLCYTALLAPVLGLVNFVFMRYSFVADHFAYLPSIPLYAAASAAGTTLAQRAGRYGRLLGGIVAATAVLAAASLSAWQCTIYRDDRTLWSDAVAKNPDAWVAHHELAGALVRRGAIDEGIAHYREVVRLRPNDPEPYLSLGYALEAQGKVPQALAVYEQALRLKPDFAAVHNNLAAVLMKQGKLDEAIAHFEAAVRVMPDYASVHINLAAALEQQGHIERAAVEYEKAVQLTPGVAATHFYLARALAVLGRLDDAIVQYAEAVRLEPTFTEARIRLAQALAAQERAKALGAQ